MYKLKKPWKGISVFYAEPEIDMATWKKYSNNYGHCSD